MSWLCILYAHGMLFKRVGDGLASLGPVACMVVAALKENGAQWCPARTRKRVALFDGFRHIHFWEDGCL